MNGTSPLKSAVPGHYTYADYKDWELAEGERYELIGGQPYAMSAPSLYHQRIASRLTAKFEIFFEGKPCDVFPAPCDVRLFYQDDERDDMVLQPDLSVVCDKSKLGKLAVNGAPDFTAEILSPSNTAIEMSEKFDLYLAAGVREYWLIDPDKKIIQAWNFENKTPFAKRTRKFREADTAQSFLFPALEIGLEQLFVE